MALARHHRLQDTSVGIPARVSPAPFRVSRRPAGCLRVVAAIRQQHLAHSVLHAGKQALITIGSAAVVLSSAAGAGQATEEVGDFAASGFIFRDTVHIIEQEDPQVQGVTIYISDFKRSITDRLTKDFFDEPSQASVTCALTGKLAFDEDAISGKDGQEVFSERKGINFLQNKTLRVRRVWDAARKTLLYIAYSTHTSGGHPDDDVGRYRTSICALPLAGNAEAVRAAK